VSVWASIASTAAEEFSDVADAAQLTQVVLRTLMAALLGGIIGFEREFHGKPAGIRTHMLVALGSALVVLVPLQAGFGEDAMSRVVQGLLAGIGFLCAGSILKLEGEEHIRGLTTAAGLWMTTGVGLAAGMGRETTAVLSTLLALVILALERPLNRLRARNPDDGEGGKPHQ
jgi:putative Mg2+ transporter-C (MgtC) family protein